MNIDHSGYLDVAWELDIRRLTTIVAADLAEYSRLVAEDEEGVISRLRSVWSNVVSPLVRDAGGRVVKTMGDGFLAEFPSPIEATRCALGIQETMAAHEAERAERNQLRFRIGVQLVDVVAVGDDSFGDAVNVAARLEAIAPVGGICMSRAMRDQVKSRIDAELNSVGDISVKNLPDPIEAWVVGEGFVQPGQKTEATPAVVVLPFDEIVAEDSFFADGIVDEITSALSSVSDITVIARQSAFIFKGRVAEVREVGRELEARYVVTGSIRRAGPRVRISVQLSSAKSGANLWSQRYDDDLDDLFELQDRVASQVAGAISPSIRASEIADARAVAPRDRKAYELYMSAFPHFWKHRREENERAGRRQHSGEGAQGLGLCSAGNLYVERDTFAIARICASRRRGGDAFG